MHLPHDLIDEVEQELGLCLRELAAGSERAGTLLDIRGEAQATATQLGRPLSVFDYVNAARDPRDRARRAAQLRELRATAHRTVPPPSRGGSDRVDDPSR